MKRFLPILAVLFLGAWFCQRDRAGYAAQYHVREEHVHIEPKPRDCDFWYAPIGDKGCHYEQYVERYPLDDGTLGVAVGWRKRDR